MFHGERIRQRREELGLTQQELGDKLMRQYNSVANWELGKHAPPMHVLEKLCEVLYVKPDYFFT